MGDVDGPVIVVKAKRAFWVVFAAVFAILIVATVGVAYRHRLWYYNYHVVGDLAILGFFFIAFLWVAASPWTFRFYKTGMEIVRWGQTVRVDYSDITSAKETIARESRGLTRGDALYIELSFSGMKKPTKVRATKDEANKELDLTLAEWLRQKVKPGVYVSLPKDAKSKVPFRPSGSKDRNDSTNP